jgi:hypothetical protein
MEPVTPICANPIVPLSKKQILNEISLYKEIVYDVFVHVCTFILFNSLYETDKKAKECLKEILETKYPNIVCYVKNKMKKDQQTLNNSRFTSHLKMNIGMDKVKCNLLIKLFSESLDFKIYDDKFFYDSNLKYTVEIELFPTCNILAISKSALEAIKFFANRLGDKYTFFRALNLEMLFNRQIYKFEDLESTENSEEEAQHVHFSIQ